jgi:thioredoxin-like negative regulator of GroEL
MRRTWPRPRTRTHVKSRGRVSERYRLDELQRYLNHPAGLTLGVLHRLITASTVVVATLWPDDYSRRTARPAAGQPDPHADDRDILRLAHIVQVPDRFTTAERRRAETLANTDRRLRIALDTTDAGFTQVLAAGPALIQRWETAEDCYGQAVITAALDARRVGAQHPVTRGYLTAAAPAYLTPTQQATAPRDWLEQALTYATTAVHGATGCLTPAPAGMGSIAGYTPADYLHQHAQRVRRTTVLADRVWQALVLVDHHHPDDTIRLASSAKRRARPDEATTLYRRTNASNGSAASPLADLLIDQGRVEEAISVLSTWADAVAGDRPAAMHVAERLAELLAEDGRTDELRIRADAGDGLAAGRLARLLAEQGNVDELRARADAGSGSAAEHIADLLAEQGNVDELRARADAGDKPAADRLAGLLAGILSQQGRVGEAITILREHFDVDDGIAAHRLARLLTKRGRVDEAIAVLRPISEAGDWLAPREPTRLLTEQGRVDEAITILRARADAGNLSAAHGLVELLAQQGRVDELTGEECRRRRYSRGTTPRRSRWTRRSWAGCCSSAPASCASRSATGRSTCSAPAARRARASRWRSTPARAAWPASRTACTGTTARSTRWSRSRRPPPARRRHWW